MPRPAIAQIGALLRAQINVSVALRTLAEGFDYTHHASGKLLVEAMTAQANALAAQIGAAKVVFLANANLPALGGYDVRVTAGGWLDEAEAELVRLRQDATRLGLGCALTKVSF